MCEQLVHIRSILIEGICKGTLGFANRVCPILQQPPSNVIETNSKLEAHLMTRDCTRVFPSGGEGGHMNENSRPFPQETSALAGMRPTTTCTNDTCTNKHAHTHLESTARPAPGERGGAATTPPEVVPAVVDTVVNMQVDQNLVFVSHTPEKGARSARSSRRRCHTASWHIDFEARALRKCLHSPLFCSSICAFERGTNQL